MAKSSLRLGGDGGGSGERSVAKSPSRPSGDGGFCSTNLLGLGVRISSNLDDVIVPIPGPLIYLPTCTAVLRRSLTETSASAIMPSETKSPS